MRSKPLVTAAVAVYNGMRFLERTIETIEAQDCPNLRIAVSDDASSDGSRELCRSWAARDTRVTLVEQERRLGWIGNYNALLERAEGECFLWLAQDDLYEPCYVSALVELLAASPRAATAYSGGIAIEPSGNALGAIPVSARYQGGVGRFRRAARFVWWSEDEKARAFRGVFQTAALRATGGLRNVRFAADALLMFEMALAGEIALDPRPLYRKHVYSESASQRCEHTHEEWLEYLDGYLAVVQGSDLPAWQRAALTASVHLRRWRVRAGQALRTAQVPALR